MTDWRIPTQNVEVLTRAFSQYEVERIVPMLWGSLDNHRRHQYITNLKPIFDQAREDGLNLLSPPPDFHAWLDAPLRTTLRGPNTAKANTISTRYYTLRTMYEHLIREDVITHNPALGYRVPPGERSSTPLPTAEEIGKLLAYLHRHDPVLFAAATLIHEHALQYTELERLTWSAFDFSQGLLLRNRTATRLSDRAIAAIQPLLTQAGGPLHTEDDSRKIFKFENRDAFRLPLWKACKNAGVANISHRELRLCGLRDHPQHPSDLGFVNGQAWERAKRHAAGLAQRLREDS